MSELVTILMLALIVTLLRLLSTSRKLEIEREINRRAKHELRQLAEQVTQAQKELVQPTPWSRRCHVIRTLKENGNA